MYIYIYTYIHRHIIHIHIHIDIHIHIHMLLCWGRPQDSVSSAEPTSAALSASSCRHRLCCVVLLVQYVVLLCFCDCYVFAALIHAVYFILHDALLVVNSCVMPCPAAIYESLAEYGLKTHRACLAQTNSSRASIY